MEQTWRLATDFFGFDRRSRPTRPIDGRQFDGEGASLGERWKRGEANQAVGRSRGGRTTKIHALTDGDLRPYAFLLTGGQVADIRGAVALLTSVPAPKQLVGDKGYDADHLRGWLGSRGTTPVIPNKTNRKNIHPFDAVIYNTRNAIERMFCRLKDFRRIATRYDKLARNFLASVCIAATIAFWINPD